jgi:hypothetical protein
VIVSGIVEVMGLRLLVRVSRCVGTGIGWADITVVAGAFDEEKE